GAAVGSHTAYPRLHSLFEAFCTCFNDADSVIVAPVYPAGEAPIPGADRDSLIAGLRARGHRHVVGLDGPHQPAPLVRNIARPGDYVVCLGAGNITQWAYARPGELAARGVSAEEVVLVNQHKVVMLIRRQSKNRG